jgi:hypothetical protein
MTLFVDDDKNICKCCQERQEKQRQAPRKLYSFAISMFNSKATELFKKDLPLKFCEYCDGSLAEYLDARFKSGEN